MLNLLMVLALSPLSQPQMAGPFQPCVWPKCVKPVVEIARVQPCIWPKCAKPEATLAQFEACVWPKCAKAEAGL